MPKPWGRRLQHYLGEADFAIGGVERLHARERVRYQKRPPDAVSWERTPDPPHNVWGDATSSFGPEWAAFRVERALTFGLGLVATADGTFYPGSLGTRMKPPETPPHPRRAVRIRGVSILATILAPANYGHWLVDILPRVAWLRRELGLSDATVVIHEKSPPVARQMLNAVGVPDARIRAVGDRGALCDELVLCSAWSFGGNNHRFEIFEETRRLREAVARAGRYGGGPERVFLARDDARRRFVTNGRELEALLAAKGFVKFNTGGMRLAEQVALLRGARHVVAIAGASLTNMIFCEPGYTVEVLAPDSMPCHFFWDLAHHTDAGSFAIHYGLAERPEEGFRSNFSVDVGGVWA